MVTKIRRLFHWFTLLGVIIHEYAHQYFCELFNVRVLDVKYVGIDGSGHVEHAEPDGFLASFFITLGPLILNTGVAVVLYAVSVYHGSSWVAWLAGWLGVSAAAHALPSKQDVDNLYSFTTTLTKSNVLYAPALIILPFLYLVWWLRIRGGDIAYAAGLFIAVWYAPTGV